MTVLLLGVGPRFEWLRSGITRGAVTVLATNELGEGNTELAINLLNAPIHFLFLADCEVDAEPGSVTGDLDHIRQRGQLAVLAVEIARRAEQTLVLPSDSPETWPSHVASVAGPSSVQVTLPCPTAAAPARKASDGLVEGYLRPLLAAAIVQSRLKLQWPRSAFLAGDEPNTSLPEVVEIAGRARILAYGPYLPLPCGMWNATVYLGFSADVGRMPFILEVGTGSTTERGFFEVDREGIFALELKFRVTSYLDLVEVRLISQESTLHGQVAFISLELEQIRE